MEQTSQKISISLPADLLLYAEEYQKTHGLSSRSEVIAVAMRALKEREWAEGYRAMAEEYRQQPDPLIGMAQTDGLEPSTEENW